MRHGELFSFIKERHAIYEAKAAGKKAPWTNDEILQVYRFCNVYRELDKETIWLAQNWRRPNQWDVDFWFAALVFRLTNWHETASELGYPVPWDPENFVNVLRDRADRGVRVYNPAYIVSTNGVSQEKCAYLAERLTEAWDNRVYIRWDTEPLHTDLLEHMHRRLMEQTGVGSFIAAQVIADAKYVGKLSKAADWWTFAASGPGSRRGMNRVIGMPLGYKLGEVTWRRELATLMQHIAPLVEKAKMPRLHAQDLQNCLCEFDKYERVRLGEGRPKSLYRRGQG